MSSLRLSFSDLFQSVIICYLLTVVQQIIKNALKLNFIIIFIQS